MNKRSDTYFVSHRDIKHLKELIVEKYDNIHNFLLYGELHDLKINELTDEVDSLRKMKKNLCYDIDKLQNDVIKLRRENGRLRNSLKKNTEKPKKTDSDVFNLTPMLDIAHIFNLLKSNEMGRTFYKINPDEKLEISHDEIMLEEVITEETKQELLKVFSSLNSIEDIIKLETIKDKFNCSIKFRKLIKLIPSLIKLNNMVGLDKIKKQIFEHICYFIQDLQTKNEIMNVVISGGPGVGKSELGKIIGEIYLALGFLKNNKFVVAKRSDFIGKYLGHTAAKTQEVINNAIGGVLFIDEVYSLGEKEQRDSFSKECIDTINQNLIEHKGELLCIIAGYEKNIQECFFNYNQGLDRRFPIRYNIEGYTSSELREIFKRKLNDWKLDDPDKTASIDFFEKNKSNFPYFGGDIEILIQNAKFIASERLMKETTKITEKCFIQSDLTKSVELMVLSKNTKKDIFPEFLYS